MSFENITLTFMGAIIASTVWALICYVFLADRGDK